MPMEIHFHSATAEPKNYGSVSANHSTGLGW